MKIAGEFGHYSCIPGYTMRGNATRRCSWKGWEGQVPEDLERPDEDHRLCPDDGETQCPEWNLALARYGRLFMDNMIEALVEEVGTEIAQGVYEFYIRVRAFFFTIAFMSVDQVA